MHVPKTAGTSLRLLLEERFKRVIPGAVDMKKNWRGNYPPIPYLLEQDDEYWHTAQLLRGHYPLEITKRFPRRPVLMTMLREPLARSISAIRHAIRHTPKYKGLTVDQLLRDEAFVRIFLTDMQTRMLIMPVSTTDPEKCPKSIRHPLQVNEAALAKAKRALTSFFFVGISERFEESMALMHHRFGWKQKPRAIRANAAPGPTPQPSDEALETLRLCNRYDIELYQHAQQLFQEALSQLPQAEAAEG